MGTNMRHAAFQDAEFLPRPRATPPLSAYGEPALLSFLRDHLASVGTSPRLTVTNVFDAGEAGGFMRQFVERKPSRASRIFVAPLTQIAFERRFARVIAAQPERRRAARR